ncbi:aldehyde oxidase GLOX-like [Andrographis paniculata]|uniref:aldehyde oxidase GLOX-like n=1 Tax=Andrographis paniculata TaxID=175694 RepID=UPI0021E6F329|nr:aldehyde oxidase GLOX-like [Andrographis paniculata]
MINPLLLFILLHQSVLPTHAGKWELLRANIGISAMHMQLLHTDRVVIFDITNSGPSNISLPAGSPCRTTDPAQPADNCTAHSVEYDVASNSVRPLSIQTNTLCSSGAVLPDGTLAQTGGADEGIQIVRLYSPCSGDSCNWVELNVKLNRPRWYATNHILPDGREIVVGGRGQFNFEFYPKSSQNDDVPFDLPFLAQTTEPNDENNLYPFVFLNTDGNLFIFANNQSILYDYTSRKVITTFPTIPGGDPRNYPSSGSAVLLPLNNLESDRITAEVLVCGGAPRGAFASAAAGTYVPAVDTCGRIRISDPNPQWVMQKMPMGRVMGDMVLLPDGNVLIINGAGSGTAGAGEMARNPVFTPVVYRPESSLFERQNSSSTPRMYHSTAALLRDGRVLVGGSNQYIKYEFRFSSFLTDLSLEAFSPSYLDPGMDSLRPRIAGTGLQSRVGYGQELLIPCTVPLAAAAATIKVAMVAPSFATHAFSMNQRLLFLTVRNVIGKPVSSIRVLSPGSGRVAPPGYYLLFVIHRDIPSEGVWIQLSN